MRFSARLAVVTAPVLAFALSACAGGSSCPEGAHKDADTNVCIKLPPDYTAEKNVKTSEGGGYIRVRNPKTLQSFSIYIEPPEDLDKRAKIVEGMAGGDLTLIAKGDTSPAKGKFFHFHNGPKDYDFAVTLVQGKEHMYRCEIQNTPTAEAKAMVEACKTVSGP